MNRRPTLLMLSLAAGCAGDTVLPDRVGPDDTQAVDSGLAQDPGPTDTDAAAASCAAFDADAARARTVAWAPAASADASSFAHASWHVARSTLRSVGLPASGSVAVSPPAVLAPLLVTAMGASGTSREQLEVLVGAPIDATGQQLVAEVRDLVDPDAPWRAEWGVGMWLADRLQPLPSWQDDAGPLLDAGMPSAVAPFTDVAVREAVRGWAQRTPCSGDAPFEIDGKTMSLILSRFAFAVPWRDALVEAPEGSPPLTFTADDGDILSLDALGTPSTELLHRAVTEDLLLVRRPLVDTLDVVWIQPTGADGVAELLDELDGEALEDLLADAESVEATLEVPPASTDTPIDLKAVWSDLGATDVFHEQQADFSAFVSDPAFHLKDAQHVHAVQLDAEGVLGWASTSITGGLPVGSGLAEHLRIDRSHLWGVRDRATGVWWSVSWVDRPATPTP